MVSLWPFKGDTNSSSAFEKTLSNLSTKLSKANAKDASLRSSLRRYKALWTLYTLFIYTLYTTILTLVTGYRNWGIPEYSAVLGGPVIIYLVRLLLSAFYGYRINNNQAHLNRLSAEKRDVITKFKEATKYDSTQKLLEKYGGEPNKSATDDPNQKDEKKGGRSRKSTGPEQPPQQRTNLPPPPTANIQRPAPIQAPGRVAQHAPIPPEQAPQPPQSPTSLPGSPGSPQLRLSDRMDSSAEFAPNAVDTQPQYASSINGPKWYDRLMDVLLGEDETKPINRLALICQKCKLVNGQAPPGAKSMAEIGRWKCSGCKAWNGEEATELAKVLEEDESEGTQEMTEKKGAVEKSDKESSEDKDETEKTPAKSTRSRKKRSSEES